MVFMVKAFMLRTIKMDGILRIAVVSNGNYNSTHS